MSRKSLFFVILAGAALGLPSQGKPEIQQDRPAEVPLSHDGQEVLAKAIQLHQAGDFEGAIREYQIFLATSPNDKTRLIACSNLGAALAHLGRYEKAIAQYQQALRIVPVDSGEAPEVAEVRFNLAVAYYKAGQIPDAARELTKLSNSGSNSMNVVLLLADCHLRMGQNKQVVELLSPFELTHEDDRSKLSARDRPDPRSPSRPRPEDHRPHPARWGLRGSAATVGYRQDGGHDMPGAIGDFGRAIELNSKLPFAHALYGRALLESGSPERAVEAFKRELVINPNDFDSNLYLGVLARQDKNLDDAL